MLAVLSNSAPHLRNSARAWAQKSRRQSREIYIKCYSRSHNYCIQPDAAEKDCLLAEKIGIIGELAEYQVHVSIALGVRTNLQSSYGKN
jgi:hypothetical protein